MDIFTDVITFNLSNDNKDLEAELYISWERVKENAEKYKQQINNGRIFLEWNDNNNNNNNNKMVKMK